MQQSGAVPPHAFLQAGNTAAIAPHRHEILPAQTLPFSRTRRWHINHFTEQGTQYRKQAVGLPAAEAYNNQPAAGK